MRGADFAAARADGATRKAGSGWWPAAVVALCVAGCALLFAKHAWAFGMRRNALDRLGVQLEPIRTAVPPGRVVGLATSLGGVERKELMHRLQFLLAPRVIAPDPDRDTVLVALGDAWLHHHPQARLLVSADTEAGPIRLVVIDRAP